jgi:NAD(P)-dependent dehydrogenase (short-subunit alcohol dehydrogenase family)
MQGRRQRVVVLGEEVRAAQLLDDQVAESRLALVDQRRQPLTHLSPFVDRAIAPISLPEGLASGLHRAVDVRSAPGRFIAVASAAATRGLPLLAAYCAAKAGVTGLVRALAAELRGSGVTANAVSPGSTATPILDESARLYGLESAEAFSSQQPIARLIRPEEVDAAILWLADAATEAVTGATVPVDGGLSL